MTTTVHRRARHATRFGSVVVAVALLLTGCTPAAPEPTPTPTRTPGADLTLSLGALLPLTGEAAASAPAAQAAIDLAIQDISDARMGLTVSSVTKDSGDSTTDTAVASVKELLGLKVSAIIGSLSDGVNKKVIDQIIGAGVVEISPGSSSLDFSRYDDSDLYWRTSPSCAREGAALGQQAADSGAKKLAIIFQTGYCEPGLPEAVSEAFERSGGEVVSRSSFTAGAADLSAQVADAVAAKPDAVAILTPTAAKLAVPGLTAAGFSGKQLFFVGLGISDHSADFAAGSLTGATATRPGLEAATLKPFTDRLLKINPDLTQFTYAAETYDAVILLALAALAAGETSGAAIADTLQAVSGGSGDGARATDFASAAKLVLAGKPVDYEGVSGPIDFDDRGDPSNAVIGLYVYGADNAFTRVN